MVSDIFGSFFYADVWSNNNFSDHFDLGWLYDTRDESSLLTAKLCHDLCKWLRGWELGIVALLVRWQQSKMAALILGI